MQFIETDAALPDHALVLANTEDVMAHAEALRHAPLVVLDFPKWTDGRAYSQAVVLRGRLRFGGEIRATGEVLVDMLPLLRRCGFDTAQLQSDQNRESAERALGHFPEYYQADTLRPRHRFARDGAHAP